MDWTGGARRRFASGKNNAVLQKQKAQFAKARALQYHQKNSQRSFNPDILECRLRKEEGMRSRRSTRRQTSASPHVGAKNEATRRPRAYEQSSKLVAGHAPSEQRSRSRSLTCRKRKGQQRESSVVYISSAKPSSQSQSSAGQLRMVQDDRDLRPKSNCSVNTDDEERLFLFKRRRLLAQSDWLGLGRLRPLQMSFTSSHDKDRVGKRRKIKASASGRDRAAKQKLSAPLFQASHPPRAHLMSGALQPDDIQIKIGSDALISQTQQSRHSRTPGKTSMRPPPTELASLPEDSMLLDADENEFESMAFSAHMPTESGEHREGYLVPIESQLALPLQHVPEKPVMRSFQHEQGLELHEIDLPVARPLSIETGPSFVPELDAAVGPGSDIRRHNRPRSTESTVQERITYYVKHNFDSHRYGAATSQDKLDEQDEDEAWWQRWFGIHQHVSTQHSTAAVKSSSVHDTTSETSDRRPLPTVLREPFVNKPISTPPHQTRVQGQDSRAMSALPATAIDNHAAVPAANSISPSTSLKQIQKLVELPAAPTNQAVDDARDEALWRQFVIGSQDSSDDATQLFLETTSQIDAGRDLEKVNHDSSYPVSSLGTSTKSTFGGTLFVNSSTSGIAKGGLDKEASERSCAALDDTAQGSSIIALDHAADICDRDSIEDDVPHPLHDLKETYKTASSTTSILDPKRFKPPKEEATVKPGMSRFRRPTRGTRGARRDHSVYDLVDSDGLNISG